MPIQLQLKNQNGDVVLWTPVATRYPELSKRYPPEDGYSISITSRSPLSPELSEMYLQCIKQGLKPTDMGLPELPNLKNMIFTAELRKDGVLIRNAEVLHQIHRFKDYERAQTGALNRLCEACGLPGKSLLEDELLNIAEIGSEVAGIIYPDDYFEADNMRLIHDTDSSPSEEPVRKSMSESEVVEDKQLQLNESKPEPLEQHPEIVQTKEPDQDEIPFVPEEQSIQPSESEAIPQSDQQKIEPHPPGPLFSKAVQRLKILHDAGQMTEISEKDLRTSIELCNQVVMAKLGVTMEAAV